MLYAARIFEAPEEGDQGAKCKEWSEIEGGGHYRRTHDREDLKNGK
jgi:hypothetical protein